MPTLWAEIRSLYLVFLLGRPVTETNSNNQTKDAASAIWHILAILADISFWDHTLERVMNLAEKRIKMRIPLLARFTVDLPFSALESHS